MTRDDGTRRILPSEAADLEPEGAPDPDGEATEAGPPPASSLPARAPALPRVVAGSEPRDPEPREPREPTERKAPWRPPTPGDPEAPTEVGRPAVGERSMPEHIGPYRVLSVLGEGGMGCVYLAEQRKPVRRFVAVKLIRAGLAGPAAVARFRVERQAMARLSHPAVAQMYEAGTTDDGYPYFVMENVPGKALTRFCAARRSSLRERLELFIEICRGVEHAHRRGILHRDLKPGNVLVTEVDGRPVPKIIDFGIAKAVDQPLTEETQLTRFGIGTPGYMSPESFDLAPGGGADVDTRTDVWALGVMLYELLVGALPFDTRGVPMLDVVRTIQQRDAERPSRHFLALEEEEQQRIAAARGTEPDALYAALAGDLDWIVGKALEKDRDRRYGSAEELAADLKRHLDLEPVSARPPSLAYRTSRFVRRHRAPVAAAGLAVSALIAGLLATGYARGEAEREAARASAEATKTRAAVEEARGVADFLVDLFEVPDAPSAEAITARQILDRGAAEIDRRLADQPLRRARLLHTMGTIYNQLQVHDEARRLVTEALDLRRDHLPEGHEDVSESLYRLGVVARELADYPVAEDAVRKALRIRRAAYGPEDPRTGEVEREMGVVLYQAGRYDEAERHIRDALAIARRSDDPEPRAAALESLGNLLKARGRCAEAVPLFEESLALREARWASGDPRLAYSFNNLGSCKAETGDLEAAKTLFERALAIQETTLGPRAMAVAAGRANLGILYRKLGEYRRAEIAFVEAGDVFLESLGPEHPFTANPMAELGILLWETGRMEAAENELRRALGIWQKNPGPEHLLTAWAHWGLANVLRDTDRPTAAESHYLQSLEVREAQLPAGHPDLRQVLEDYARLLERLGREEDLAAVRARLGDVEVDP